MSLIWWWWHWGVHVEWGSVPGYFAGLAFGITALTYGSGLKDKRREQASLVSCWTKSFGHNYELQVWVKNGSSQQITAVEVFGSLEPRAYGSLTGEPVEDLPDNKKFPQHREVLGPGEEEVVLSVFKDLYDVELGGVRFVDARGKRWERTYKHLKKLKKL